MSKPAGPIRSTGTPRQAARRRMVPAFCAMSGWYSANRIWSKLSYVSLVLVRQIAPRGAFGAALVPCRKGCQKTAAFRPAGGRAGPILCHSGQGAHGLWRGIFRRHASAGDGPATAAAPAKRVRLRLRAGRLRLTTHTTTEEPTRRDFIEIAAMSFAGVGAALALWPF